MRSIPVRLFPLAVALLAAATTLPAATSRVCWEPAPGAPARCSEPMDTAAANSFLAQVGREYPGAQHWMIAESAQNRWERARWISTGIAVAAALYDMHTTQQVLAAGGRESNFLYGSHPSTARLYGFSLGLVAGQTLAIEWLRHRHPEKARSLDRTGFFANVGSSALHIAAGVHNESVIDQQKRLAQ